MVPNSRDREKPIWTGRHDFIGWSCSELTYTGILRSPVRHTQAADSQRARRDRGGDMKGRMVWASAIGLRGGGSGNPHRRRRCCRGMGGGRVTSPWAWVIKITKKISGPIHGCRAWQMAEVPMIWCLSTILAIEDGVTVVYVSFSKCRVNK